MGMEHMIIRFNRKLLRLCPIDRLHLQDLKTENPQKELLNILVKKVHISEVTANSILSKKRKWNYFKCPVQRKIYAGGFASSNFKLG